MFNEMFGAQNGEKIGKVIKLTLILLSIFLLAKAIGAFKEIGYIGKDIYPQRTIMASGDGEAYAIPDIATFSFSIVESGSTVADAQEKAQTKIDKALSALKDSGIDDKDIKTTNYSFYPKYEWNQIVCITTPCPVGKNVLVGYEVNETITVKIRNTDKAGDLVTKVGSIGASNVSGVEFAVDDKDKYVAQAREQAIQKAQVQAKQLAKDLGVRLGKMVSFSENGNYPVYYGQAVGMGGGDMKVNSIPAPASLPIGENKITSQVTITYEIE